jgi:hypothetical protein
MTEGGFSVDSQIKEKLIGLRAAGWGYATTARELSLPVATVKSFCQRNRIDRVIDIEEKIRQTGTVFCQNCTRPLGKRTDFKQKSKKFCSDKCRMEWWKTHPEALDKKAIYHFVCQECGRAFESYGNANRKFCSRSCAARHRNRTKETVS